MDEGQRGMEHDDADVAGGEEGGDEAEACLCRMELQRP